MSAGICLMNKSCIVLAADSAVTVGERETIFNSADKVYSLSTKYPIGCIIYQNMEFMDIPIGIVLSKFRNSVDSTENDFKNAIEYFDAFKKFLSEEKDFFRFKKNEFRFLIIYYKIVRDEFEKQHKIESDKLLSEKQEDLNPEEIDKATENAIKNIRKLIKLFNKDENYNVKEYIVENYNKDLVNLFKDWFKNINLKDEQLSDLIEIIITLIESDFKIQEYTGINISGYGKDQIFPSSAHYRLYGIIDGKIKYEDIENTQISVSKASSIKTLAQSDVIELFAYGINNSFLQNIGIIVKENLEEKTKQIKHIVEDKEKLKLVKELFTDSHDIIRNKVKDYAWDNFLKPLEKSIAILPNDEIIQLAEEMINLTSLRRKIIVDKLAGTVGGPVDIALIDIENGFQWKCKKRGYVNDGK